MTDPVSYEFQWERDGAPIPQGTTSSYTVVAGDEGASLTVTVTATNAAGSTSAVAGSTPVVAGTVSGAADFTDDFTSFDSTKWWPCYPYNLGGQVDEGSQSSWNAGTDTIGGALVTPFSVISDDTASRGTCLRLTCRQTTASEASSISALMGKQGSKAPASATDWVGPMMVSVPGWIGGYVEWRVRFPGAGNGIGMWPALWLDGQTETGSSDGYTYTRAAKQPSEIDMLETFGVPGDWYSTVHAVNDDGSIGNDRRVTSATDNSWHAYGIEWDSESIINFYYDRSLVGSGTAAEAALYADQPLCARMNFTVTTNTPWTGMSAASTPGPLYMDLDTFQHFAQRPF